MSLTNDEINARAKELAEAFAAGDRARSTPMSIELSPEAPQPAPAIVTRYRLHFIREDAILLARTLELAQDEGPEGEGWKSLELATLVADVATQLMAQGLDPLE